MLGLREEMGDRSSCEDVGGGVHQDLEGPNETPWRRKWQPISPVFLPRESHGERSLVGCCP